MPTKPKKGERRVKYGKVIPGKWVKPVMKGYIMCCCDCGLVHKMNFRAVKIVRSWKDGRQEYFALPSKEYQVELKAWRSVGLTKKYRQSNSLTYIIKNKKK